MRIRGLIRVQVAVKGDREVTQSSDTDARVRILLGIVQIGDSISLLPRQLFQCQGVQEKPRVHTQIRKELGYGCLRTK